MLCQTKEIITALKTDNRTLEEHKTTITIDENEGNIGVYKSSMS